MKTVALVVTAAGLFAACGAPDSPAPRHPDTAAAVSRSPVETGSLVALDTAGIGTALDMPRPAPNVTLPLLRGDSLRLANYQGQVILANFWTTWCVPCRRESADLATLHHTLSDSGLLVLRISLDEQEPATIRPLAEKEEVPYPFALADRDVADQFGGVYGLPTTFVIDPSGHIVRRIVGPIAEDSIRSELRSMLPTSQNQ